MLTATVCHAGLHHAVQLLPQATHSSSKQWLRMAAGAEDGAAASSAAEQQVAPAQLSPEQERQQKLEGVLAGSVPIQLYLEFLYSHNHADVQLLKNAKVGSQSMQAHLISHLAQAGNDR